MQSDEVIERVLAAYDGIVAATAWGERALFYNPGRRLARGTYFLTVKERDGENDRGSALDRDGVFRVGIGVRPSTYERLFGDRPSRPPQGGVVAVDQDLTALDTLLPHPVYAWTGWVCVLSPSEATFEELRPLVDDAYGRAVDRFDERVRTSA